MALSHVSFANGKGPLIIIINYDDRALFCLCLCYTGPHRNAYSKVCDTNRDWLKYTRCEYIAEKNRCL